MGKIVFFIHGGPKSYKIKVKDFKIKIILIILTPTPVI